MYAVARSMGSLSTPRAPEAVFHDVDANSTASDNATTAATHTSSEPFALLVTLTVIYIIIFVAGILGNSSTCFVIYRNRCMHTATNFYLFSLAVSDLILLVCGLPIEIQRLHNPHYYPMGEPMCITLGLASETSANATILTITAFTFERYIAICKPFCAHTISKLTRALRFIVVIWVVAVGSAVPQAMQYGIVQARENGVESLQCNVKGEGVHQVFVVSSVIFFGVPMTLIIVLYALIGLKLRTSRILHPAKNISVDSERHSRNSRYRNIASQNRVIHMLVAVTLAFFICWAPFHVQRLLAIYGLRIQKPSPIYYKVYDVLTYLSGVLYYLSTAINPILYNIMSNKFRNAFKLTLATWCQQDGGPRLWRTYSSLMAHRQEEFGSAVMQRMRERRVARRLAQLHTGSTQLCEASPRAQLFDGRQLSSVTESSNGNKWINWQFPYDFSDSLEYPRSISNSSMKEVDAEQTTAELATFMHQVNCDIHGENT